MALMAERKGYSSNEILRNRLLLCERSFRFAQSSLAERKGFEPLNRGKPITRLAGERIRPTLPSLRK